MYEKIFESSKLLTPENPNFGWTYMFYVLAWDACLILSGAEWARAYRDGTKAKLGQPSGGYLPLGRVGGTVAWLNRWTFKIYPAFEINGLPNPNEVLNPNWDIDYDKYPSYLAGTFIDDIKRLYLHQRNANRLDLYNLDTGEKVGAIEHNAGETFRNISWVKRGQVAGLCPGGKVRIMTYLGGNLEVVETGRIDAFRVAAYDCQNHNFIAVGTDGKVRVYCREAWPASLSNPEFEPATVYGFMGNRVKTRLAGQDGEPCRDWWIHWALEGVGGGQPLGSLDKYVSKTDDEGWAENIYYGPDDGSTGQTRIKASVVLY
ncbi:MAG: hypothetical protein JRI66_11690 [Deltaproteobacteria bacterium]|nr:hypothetical protein [Deltaproteobacteria bacterium]